MKLLSLLVVLMTRLQKKMYYRMDTIWGFISELKRVDSSPRFKYLSMVAKLVLCIPHSNAEEERVFNLM